MEPEFRFCVNPLDRVPESTTTREAVGLSVLPAAPAAGKKRQKHIWASMLNLQSHPVWARIKKAGRISPARNI
jgi:hypothetical protein